MIKWYLNIVFVLGISISFGQQLNINLDKEEVKIGEPFTLTYSVISDVKLDSIAYSNYEDFFPGRNSDNSQSDEVSSTYNLEISKRFKDTTYQEGKDFIWKGSYNLIAWDSAYVVIPPEFIYIGDSLYHFPAGLIHVLSPVVDATKPIYDINESFTELPPKNALFEFFIQHWWWISISFILIIALIIYLIKRSRREPTPLSLREKILAQIDALEKSKAYEVNLKEYYYELSVILRKFFAAHYQSQIMDKTTAEIEVVLSENGLDKNMILLTRQLLMQSDMVKFAKSVPALIEIQSITNEARRVVNQIADLELNNEK